MAISPPNRNPQLEDANLPQLIELITERLDPNLVPDADWPGLIKLANRHGLAPMLFWVVKKQFKDAAGEARFKRLADIASVIAFRCQMQWESQVEVQEVLSQAEIPAIWLKGLTLANRLYPQFYLRPMDDLDILVQEQHRRPALLILQELGFLPREITALAKKMNPAPQPYADEALIRRDTWPILLELHFRLLSNDSLQAQPEAELDWFWQQTETWIQEGTSFTVFKPEAHLLYLCAHAILEHGEAQFRLIRYFDLHCMVVNSELNWELIVAQAVDLRWSFAVERALILTSRYFATPFPDWVLAELRNRRKRDEDTDRVTRLQGQENRWVGTWRQLAPYPPGERFRRLMVLLAPPREYMRNHYAIPAGRAVLPYYFYRWWDAGREVARAYGQRTRSH